MATRMHRNGRVLLAAALAAMGLSGCHKRGVDADGASSRGLQVEAYDPPIPKAPLHGKLDTLAQHPEDVRAASSSPASTEPPADSSQGPAPKG
jgi:hypothetical protein